MGRIIAIGDVHGCTGLLDHLLDTLAVSGDDQVVFLGAEAHPTTPVVVFTPRPGATAFELRVEARGADAGLRRAGDRSHPSPAMPRRSPPVIRSSFSTP